MTFITFTVDPSEQPQWQAVTALPRSCDSNIILPARYAQNGSLWSRIERREIVFLAINNRSPFALQNGWIDLEPTASSFFHPVAVQFKHAGRQVTGCFHHKAPKAEAGWSLRCGLAFFFSLQTGTALLAGGCENCVQAWALKAIENKAKNIDDHAFMKSSVGYRYRASSFFAGYQITWMRVVVGAISSTMQTHVRRNDERRPSAGSTA